MYEVGTWKNANKENEVLFGDLESSVTVHIHNLAETVCWGDHAGNFRSFSPAHSSKLMCCAMISV